MIYRHLLNQISNWHKKQQHEEIISAIQSLPKQEQTNDLIYLLARALLNIDDYSAALSQLNRIKETYDGHYCVCYGFALYCLHQEDESLQWFKKAQEEGIEEIDELPNTYYPKNVSTWIERAKKWAPRRIEKNTFEKERRRNRSKHKKI